MRTVNPELLQTTLHRSKFILIGFTTASGSPRTVGVVPEFEADGSVWFGSLAGDLKIRCLRARPEVSVVASIPTRWPVLNRLAPPATISFRGRATVHAADDPVVPAEVSNPNLKLPTDDERGALVGVRIEPTSDYLSYGVGIPVWKMTDVELARGRTPNQRGLQFTPCRSTSRRGI